MADIYYKVRRKSTKQYAKQGWIGTAIGSKKEPIIYLLWTNNGEIYKDFEKATKIYLSAKNLGQPDDLEIVKFVVTEEVVEYERTEAIN